MSPLDTEFSCELVSMIEVADEVEQRGLAKLQMQVTATNTVKRKPSKSRSEK